MIPKVDPISILTIKEKGVESIVDWFYLHKRSFYTLGWAYLRNQQQMEELFYQSIIKVHKKLPRYKNETSFETWVTSVFIETCRELSDGRILQVSKEGEVQQELFNALNQLKVNEKEAMVLTYIKGISKEEGAHLLQVSVEKMKELLFSGIQSFRKVMGARAAYNGCKQYHEVYIDYLERTLDRPRKIDLEKHLYHCEECQEDLAAFQEVMLTLLNLPDRLEELHVPPNFMEKVKDRLGEKDKHRQQKNKKRIRKGLIFAGVFALLMSIEVFTRMFSNLYYTWTEDDQDLRAFLQQDLGETLNLEAESSGINIKIKSAIADDVQTLIFYEIEDTEEDNQFAMENFEGVFVENQDEIMSPEGYLSYYPPDLESEVNKEEKNVFHGKMSLLPLTSDKGTIKLKITKLHKLIRNPSDPNGFSALGNMEYETGEWTFEIPVTKQPSVKYELDEEIEVEGIPVRFDELTIAPTATVLHYASSNEQPRKRIDVLNFDNLEVNDKKLKADSYSGSFLDTNQVGNWFTFQIRFDPLIGVKPKEVNIQLESVHLTYDEQKTIELNSSQEYPQTFEYAGSTISIDKVEVGQSTKVVFSNHEIANRAYERLHFQILSMDENNINSMEMSSEEVIMDKDGVKYDMNEPVSYEEIEQPRHFVTVFSTEIKSNSSEEKVIPKSIEIYGYSALKYLDDVVKISLE
jgi:DNA-directed RNA polymerase specialized sigma24 family protein/Holliday junction resolvase